MKFSKYAQTALAAANAGADVLMKYYQKTLNVEYKGITDPVSQADKNSQKAVIKVIKDIFPQHGVLAEEDGVNEIKKDYCWIIDPLDGTVNFVHGVPLFCVSIGLKYKNEIIVGVIYSPVMKEIFIAEKGKGAYLNGKRIKVSDTSKLIRSLAVTGFPYELEGRRKRVFGNFENIVSCAQGIRRLGSAALDMAYVACGRFDFFWEETLKPWDIAAGIIIVKEAGGIVTDYNGTKNYFSSSTLLAANKKLHKQVLKILNETK
ncbi:inositol monophosphatase family protein [Endomicrobium proavitum]|uniref:Inositol-1-monophosphatase n=1 Tax=Endomicrobium proavitum TaxID=1408281 RepID=A0A0G3WI69_9BACT|nr:inositol monophosphatase family protein [Endomicrobium proavitum]AKL97562.1 Inositol-1-monophosphatase [Endomicrobium proavitum]